MLTIQILKNYSLFGGLDEGQIIKILPMVELENFEPDTDIIVEGRPNDKVYFIVEGNVKVIKEGVVLANLGIGETFGEMEVLDVMPSAATIKSHSEVMIMSISNKALKEISKIDIKTYSLLIMNLARDISRRLRRMNNKQVGAFKYLYDDKDDE